MLPACACADRFGKALSRHPKRISADAEAATPPSPRKRRAVRGKCSACRTGQRDSFSSSWPAWCRPSTLFGAAKEDVDARDKPAHDDFGLFASPRRLVARAEILSPASPARKRGTRASDGILKLWAPAFAGTAAPKECRLHLTKVGLTSLSHCLSCY